METTVNNIVENNKLIAEFMSAKVTGEYLGSKGGYKDTVLLDFTKADTPSDLKFISDCDLKYNTSWDWLMPVVEKINSDIHYNESKEYRHLMSLKITTNIKVLYKAIVEFIKWYNNLNQ